MIDNLLKNELKKQKILPILNTTSLENDSKRLENYLANNLSIKNIEITLRQENSFEIAKILKKDLIILILDLDQFYLKKIISKV